MSICRRPPVKMSPINIAHSKATSSSGGTMAERGSLVSHQPETHLLDDRGQQDRRGEEAHREAGIAEMIHPEQPGEERDRREGEGHQREEHRPRPQSLRRTVSESTANASTNSSNTTNQTLIGPAT